MDRLTTNILTVGVVTPFRQDPANAVGPQGLPRAAAHCELHELQAVANQYEVDNLKNSLHAGVRLCRPYAAVHGSDARRCLRWFPSAVAEQAELLKKKHAQVDLLQRRVAARKRKRCRLSRRACGWRKCGRGGQRPGRAGGAHATGEPEPVNRVHISD